MSRTITRLGFTALALAAGTVAFAQSSTTGALNGLITDAQGNPVAGAVVRITSAQVTRLETTAVNGTYRFGLLNPGAWRITVTKAGMQTLSRDIVVNTNTTHPVNFKIAAVTSATVEVVGTQTIAADVTSTQTGYTANMGELAQLPIGRDINTVAYFSPGVVDSGQLGGISIAGASGLENQYIVDGLMSNDLREGFSGAGMPSDFVDQVEVQTGGYKPEFSALGGVFNVVTKSGSNDFAGSAWFTTDLRGSQAVAKRNDLFRQAEANNRFDYGAAAGGAILKDKLFYFVGVNNTSTETPDSAQEPNNNGLTNSQQKTTNLQVYGKINWYLAMDHQLAFTAKVDRFEDKLPVAYPTNGTAQFGRTFKSNTDNFGLNYDWTISSSLFLSAKYGQTKFKDTQTPVDLANFMVQDNIWFSAGPGSLPGGNPAGLDPSTRFTTGGYGRYTPLSESTTSQLKIDLSWFLGSHNLKFGISQTDADFTLLDGQSGPMDTPYGGSGVYPYRIAIRSNGGVFNGIDKIYYYNDATVKGKYQAIYAQDTWEITPGLRFFYGFRFESQELKGNDGKVFLKKFDDFKDQLQPRLGFTWDVNRDGKTKISGSFAKYFEQIPMQPAMRQGGNETYVRNRYSAANSSYIGATGAWAINAGATPSITDFAANFAASPLADGTRLPERRETTLGIDHTLPSGWSVGMHAKHRELVNPMEDSVISDIYGNTKDGGLITDPGTYGYCPGYAIIWNPQPGAVSWTANNNSSTPGAKISWDSTPFQKAFNIYQSVDLTLEKKTTKWFISASYTWSRLYGTYEGLGQASNGQADANITSSFDYWSYVGKGELPLDRTHVAKIFGSYTFDVFQGSLTAGFNITAQSGTPVSLFDDGSTTHGQAPGFDTANYGLDGFVYSPVAPNPVLYANLDIGAYGDAVPANFKYGQYGRTPTNINTDVKLEYAIKFKRFTFKPSIDIFNLFNIRSASSIYQLATDQNGNADNRYGVENGWMVGRRFRFGLKLQF